MLVPLFYTSSSLLFCLFSFSSFKANSVPNSQKKHGSMRSHIRESPSLGREAQGKIYNLESRIYTLFCHYTLCIYASRVRHYKMLHVRKGQLTKGYRECSRAKLLSPSVVRAPLDNTTGPPRLFTLYSVCVCVYLYVCVYIPFRRWTKSRYFPRTYIHTFIASCIAPGRQRPMTNIVN